MRVSVVVCTYNRAEGLRQTLEGLRRQRYRQFEVIVVNGPSTDHTQQVLDAWASPVKVRRNLEANLSRSRNIGIRAAGGEIVAFIDDDAIPEPSWLAQAIPAFDDPEVAGVGGIVLDHTGMSPQYVFSGANRFGVGMYTPDQTFDLCCVPGAPIFPYLQGTNALFRRNVLGKVGLFDETFDFYLDETDLCCRIIDEGYVLKQLEHAPVHHKYLPSTRRNDVRVVTNWYSIARNHVYFGYRHAVSASEADILREADEFQQRALRNASDHELRGDVLPGHVQRVREAFDCAVPEGVRLGRRATNVRFQPVVLETPDFAAVEEDRMRDVEHTRAQRRSTHSPPCPPTRRARP
jgi:glycogen synthase